MPTLAAHPLLLLSCFDSCGGCRAAAELAGGDVRVYITALEVGTHRRIHRENFPVDEELVGIRAVTAPCCNRWRATYGDMAVLLGVGSEAFIGSDAQSRLHLYLIAMPCAFYGSTSALCSGTSRGPPGWSRHSAVRST